MKKLYNNILYLRALMLVMVTGLFAFGANAQDFTVAQTFNSTYLGERDTVLIDTIAPNFSADTRYYLYRDNDVTGSYTDGDDLLDTSSSIGDTTLTYVWDESGLTDANYRVAAITGFGTNQTTDITDVTITGVPSNDAETRTNGILYGSLLFPFATNDYYTFDNVGSRGLETGVIPELDVDNSVSAFVNFDFYLTNIPENSDDSVVLEYSIDGTTWITLIDSLNNGYDVVLGMGNRVINVSAELPNMAKDPATRFRFRQGPTSATTQRSDYTEGENAWYIDPDNFQVVVGNQATSVDRFVSFYSVNRPFTNFAITDTTGTQDYYGGGGFEIDATFTGYQDQVSEFNYVAVFRNSVTEQSFTVENTDMTFGETENTPSEFVYDFDLDGVIPTDIDYSDNTSYDDWTVSVEAFTGSAATVSNSENLLTGGTVEGGTNVTNFTGDSDRFFLSDEVNIETVNGASVTLDLNKTLSQLYPDGTEVVLEYATNGSDFTALIADGRTEAAISLNDTIDGGFDPFTYDVSTITGLVSTTTQFRVRQLSNSGTDLDTWGIGQLSLSTEGSLLENNSTITYSFTGITINPPVIDLDPVDVPDDFIYPGDEVTLTYNITSGAYPTGTTFTAMLEGGTFDYVIGSSDLITPGDDQDHEITVTIPPIVGGDYSVKLVTNPESNSITIPIYNTEVAISEISSDNGIFDGATDIFYPGDNITATYSITGSVGTGAELFFEVLDQGDNATTDDDEWVVLNSAAGADIDGTIDGTLPTDINFDDPSNAEVRIRIGNGLLANSSTVAVQDLAGNDVNYFISKTEGAFAYIFDVFDEDLISGNDPTDIDKFIGSSERSATTIPFELPFGGGVYFEFNNISYDFDQEIAIQVSNDEGANWETLETLEYTGAFLTSEYFLRIPESAWGDAVRFRFVYNEDGAAAEFENEVEIWFAMVVANESVSANSAEFDISGQLRRYTISLEDINDGGTENYVVGEEVTVEYTTEGSFPANTGFALLFEGKLDGDGDPATTGDANSGEDFFSVLATSTTLGSGSFTFNVPDMAYEFDGTDAIFTLYQSMSVVAYDATGGADFLPNETIVVDMDDQFLTIEGTDEEDGNYTFDLAGDRSLLTDAFDLSAAQSAILSFTYSSGIGADDNVETIPQLQYSIDAGATFVNMDLEDSDLEGGYIVGNMSYAVEVPSAAVTATTHFRWVQNLNLGSSQDTWTVNGISVELVNGNEITADYKINNDDQGITVSHPSTGDYELTQVDPSDAIFNGESSDLSFSPIFETSDAFPANTSFTYLLYDPSAGDYVIDPETNDPLVIGTASAVGTFTATIPFYVENGSYQVRLVATKTGAEEPYYYIGSENDGLNIGTIEVFLRVVKTTIDFEDTDVLYAGSTVTFNVDIENDETNTAGTDDLFATLLAKNYSGGDDLVVATQQGVDPMEVQLPTYIRSGQTFEVQLSEDAPLGEVGDLVGDSDLLNLEDDFSENFTAGGTDREITVSFDEYINSADFYRAQFDYSATSTASFELHRSIDFGDYVHINSYSGTSGNDLQSSSVYLTTGQYVRYRWVLTSGGDLTISDVLVEDTGNNLERNYGSSLTPDGLATMDVSFENDFGRGLITSREFEAGELANSTLISFDVTFGKLAEEIGSDQFLIFEYSTDGGTTYTEISSFPDVDDEMTLSGENFLFDVTEDMQTNASIFRFRQEERNNIDVEIDNFSFLAGKALPFEYVSQSQSIAPQVLLVTSLGADASCLDEEIAIGYEVRGRFGADNIVTVSYDEVDGSASGTIDAEFADILEGTGTLNALLPTDVFTNGESNKSFRFNLNYDDDTFIDDGNDFASTSEPLSEGNIEVVAPIDLDATASVTSGTLACEGDDLIVTLSSPQNYFSYEVINSEDGSVVSGDTPLMYDPEEDDREIMITGVTEDADLQLRVTAAASTGALAACSDPIISTSIIEVRFDENLELNAFNSNLFINEVVEAGEEIQICEGSSVILRLLRDGNFVGTDNIEWFRDNINNPLPDGDSELINDANGINNRSGEYFARITTGSCSYLTESIIVTVLEQVEMPEITVGEGNLIDCENADPVVLEAPEGFAFYEWSTPVGTMSSRVIEAEFQGTYTVQVSNSPFSGSASGCGSNSSDPVYVERYNLSEFGISTSTSITTGDVIVDGQEIEGCEGRTIYFYDETSRTANGGTIEIIRDGVSVGFTTSNNTFLEESGVYSFNWINDDAPVGGTTCTVSSVEFTLTISEQPDAVTVTTTDVTDFCEGNGSVTITAPAGFAQYRWLNNGSAVDSNTDGFGNTNNTLTVDYAGTFSVQVSNQADGTGCFSTQSNEIDVNVRQFASDAISLDQVNTLCGPGTARYELFGTRADYNYSIFNSVTDAQVGNTFRGNGNTASIFIDIPVTEQSEFYVMVEYASGDGCPDPEPSTTFTVSFYNVSLELDGNRIDAISSGGFGWDEIEWFRNGVRLQQRSGDNSIFVTDNAEYSAEVTYDDGACVITTNTVAVEGARIQTFFGDLEASTYPNPTTDFVNIDMKGGDLGAYSISVANLSGQIMLSEGFEKTEEDEELTVDLRDIEKGIYTLIIQKGNAVQSFRIVKQ